MKDKVVARSVCCYYRMDDSGKCLWCGQPSERGDYKTFDPLVEEIESLLCDWNSLRFLETTDLHDNIAKVYNFIKGRERMKERLNEQRR